MITLLHHLHVLLFLGMALTDHEMVDIHYNKMASLQVLLSYSYRIKLNCINTLY